MKKIILTLVFLLFTAAPCWAEETIEGRTAAQWNMAGILYGSNNQFELGIDAMSKAIQLEPNVATHYNNRGLIYFNSGRSDMALIDYQKSIELDPKAPITYNNRGNLYYTKKEYDKALSDFVKVLELEPENLKGLFGKARSLDALNKKKEARAAYQEFLKVAPADNKNRSTAQQRLNALR